MADGVGFEDEIYALRFGDDAAGTREATWKVLCRVFFPRWIAATDRVLDLGAGDGCFIRNVRAAARTAVDVGAHVLELEAHGVRAIQAPATDFRRHLDAPVDVIMASNFFEHLPDKRTFLAVLRECLEALRPGGRLLVLQPNLRYVGAAYWDYVDHQIPITEQSLAEALVVTGFAVEELIPRFLPYTANSRLGAMVGGGRNAFLVELYLKLPFLWRWFGQQTFAVGRRP